MKRNPSRLLEKENPRERLEPFREWPVSTELMDNTTDMQSVSRTRPKTARNCAISHKTTGPSAAARAGSVEREPRTARQGEQGPLVLMRNYRPRPEMPWPDGWNASRFSLWPATSFPIPELQNACVFAPTIVTCRCGSPRSTRLPAMAVCKPAAASGCVQSAAQGGGTSPRGNTAGNGPASRLWW